jgi:hypothetical protein
MPLQYATPRRGGGSRRLWAWGFLLSGVYALACIPAVFVFEHLRWEEAPLHITSFFACIVCVISAIMYLWSGRAAGGESVGASSRTRTLAYIAIALAGGFLLLCAIVVVLLANSMKDF